jgi:hypothetical protein
MGGQQHAWQLTLEPDSSGAVFTGQPTVGPGDGDYWAAGVLPRIGQHRNTLVALYAPSLLESLVFNTSITHAHLFREGFSELVSAGGWTVGRAGEVYVALYSALPVQWSEGAHQGRDLVAPGRRNAWLCHVGDRETNGEFQQFVDMVAGSEVEVTLGEEDALLQCLDSVGCLGGHLPTTLACLTRPPCTQLCSLLLLTSSRAV